MCHGACSAEPIQIGPVWLSRLRKGPSMQFRDSILASLVKPIDRRQFRAIVDRFDGDAYDKSFTSWHHLVALIYAQLSHAVSARPGGGIQCQLPASLSSGGGASGTLDAGGCQCP